MNNTDNNINGARALLLLRRDGAHAATLGAAHLTANVLAPPPPTTMTTTTTTQNIQRRRAWLQHILRHWDSRGHRRRRGPPPPPPIADDAATQRTTAAAAAANTRTRAPAMAPVNDNKLRAWRQYVAKHRTRNVYQ